MAQWQVRFLDGRIVSDEDAHWSEISLPRTYGRETLYLLKEPAVSLTAFIGRMAHELRAPDDETRFFRHFRARSPGLGSELLYHAIGYLGPSGRVVLEVDPHGNTRWRAFPTL